MAGRAEKDAWIQRVLGIVPGQAGDAASALRRRLADVLSDAATLADAQASARLRDMAGNARAALAEGTAGAAASLVDAMETVLAEASRTTRNASAAAEAGHKVAYAKLLLEWRRAQAKTRAQLQQLAGALLADAAVQADPRFGDVKEAASDLTDVMPEFDAELETLLDKLEVTEDPDERAELVSTARDVIGECQSLLDSADELAELGDFAADEFGQSDLGGDLRAVLRTLATALSARQ